MADSKEKLFSEFSPVSTQEWMDKVKVDLKGADFEKRLVWKTNEGFKVQPFYRMEDLQDLKTLDSLPGEFPYLRGTKKDNLWHVRQEIEANTAEEANKKALDVLMKGVDSLSFHICAEVDAAFVANLLKDICLDCVEVNFNVCPAKVVEFTTLFVAYLKEAKIDLATVKGSVNYDFFGAILSEGKKVGELAETAKALIELTQELPSFKTINVTPKLLNNAGAFIYQELGYALSWGNEYLNTLTQAGLDAATVAKNMKFNFGISSNYFMEIAKFRAARMLWANIVASYTDDKCAAKMQIHAETSTFNMTVFDAHVNLLRSQTEAMSAALAGVDSMTVVPFDVTYKNADDFSERLARNQQLLLKEESHFDKVVDPAAGSYTVETLTASIAKQAWGLFLSVEEADGFAKALEAGDIQKTINETNEKRHKLVAQRRELVLGSNQYPNFTELAGEKRPVEAKHVENADFATLNFDRATSEFEQLRLQTEASSKRPKAFMVTIGNLAMRQARAQYSCNFLACAGYEVIDNLGFKTVEEGVEAAMKANADIVVLCSSDPEYAEYAIPAFKALNGRAEFIVAGNPPCADELREAGIENFVHVRVNVLDTLREFNAKLLK